jgi:membrane fusion protein, multidrug efflux system
MLVHCKVHFSVELKQLGQYLLFYPGTWNSFASKIDYKIINKKHQMMNRISKTHIGITLSSMAFVLVFLLAGCSSESSEKPEPLIRSVKVVAVSNNARAKTFSYTGVIKENSNTKVSFRVGGPLVQLNVKQGDFVKKGQLIASIDSRDYELNVAASKAQFEQAESEYERYQKLFDLKKLPANTLEKLKLAYEMNSTAFENAKNQLKDTKLFAPVSGYVFEKMAENHETIGPGQTILSIIDNDDLEVVIFAPESNLKKLSNDLEVTCSVKNAGLSTVPLVLKSLSEKAGENQMFEIKFSFAVPMENVKPGMSAEVNIKCKMDESGSFYIPIEAVFHQDGTDYVWVFSEPGGKVSKRKIEIGPLADQGMIQVRSGLGSNDKIVSAGIHFLQEGQLVKPIQTLSETNVGGIL